MLRGTLARQAVRATTSGVHVKTSFKPVKSTTGIHGIPVHPDPCAALVDVYTNTLKLLKTMPETAAYRQSIEALTTHRLKLVEGHQRHLDQAAAAAAEETEGKPSVESDESRLALVESLEEEIGLGQLEQVVDIANNEFRLAAKVLEWKVWEEMETPPPEGQWTAFPEPGHPY